MRPLPNGALPYNNTLDCLLKVSNFIIITHIRLSDTNAIKNTAQTTFVYTQDSKLSILDSSFLLIYHNSCQISIMLIIMIKNFGNQQDTHGTEVWITIFMIHTLMYLIDVLSQHMVILVDSQQTIQMEKTVWYLSETTLR